MTHRPARLPRTISNAQPRTALRTWHAHFAAWLAAQPVTPSIEEQLAAARGFVNANRDAALSPLEVTRKQLRTLKEREDFQGVVREIEQGGVEAARVKFLSHLPDLIDLHLWGARRSREKDDTRGLVSYTGPALDRAVPRHPELLVQQQVVTLQLSAKQLAALDAEPIEVTCQPQPLPSES
jgi:hypothetical protein